MPISYLHQLCLRRQGNQWRQALGGVSQAAVDVKLKAEVFSLKTSYAEDDGLSTPVCQVRALQVYCVQLPVLTNIPHKSCQNSGVIITDFIINDLSVDIPNDKVVHNDPKIKVQTIH